MLADSLCRRRSILSDTRVPGEWLLHAKQKGILSRPQNVLRGV